jgi:hypothetical protein
VEEEFFGQEAEDGRRRGYSEVIDQLGRTGGEGTEAVVGLHGAEDSFVQCHLEVGWRFDGRDFVGKVVPEAEVFGSPGDAVREALEAGGEATYCESLFAGVNVPEEMNFYAAGEVEAALNGCFDRRGLVDSDHRCGELSSLVKSMCRVTVFGWWEGNVCSRNYFEVLLTNRLVVRLSCE